MVTRRAQKPAIPRWPVCLAINAPATSKMQSCPCQKFEPLAAPRNMLPRPPTPKSQLPCISIHGKKQQMIIDKPNTHMAVGIGVRLGGIEEASAVCFVLCKGGGGELGGGVRPLSCGSATRTGAFGAFSNGCSDLTFAGLVDDGGVRGVVAAGILTSDDDSSPAKDFVNLAANGFCMKRGMPSSTNSGAIAFE